MNHNLDGLSVPLFNQPHRSCQNWNVTEQEKNRGSMDTWIYFRIKPLTQNYSSSLRNVLYCSSVILGANGHLRYLQYLFIISVCQFSTELATSNAL